jgi:hypothetical protein
MQAESACRTRIKPLVGGPNAVYHSVPAPFCAGIPGTFQIARAICHADQSAHLARICRKHLLH